MHAAKNHLVPSQPKKKKKIKMPARHVRRAEKRSGFFSKAGKYQLRTWRLKMHDSHSPLMWVWAAGMKIEKNQ
jgi:hypothetical protein